MKKLIALLLALTLCFSLIACGQAKESEDKDDEQIHQEEEKETEAPTEAPTEPVNYEEILLSETWICTQADFNVSFTFHKGGTGIYNGGMPMDMTWSLEGNTVTYSFFINGEEITGSLNAEEKDGIYYLVHPKNAETSYIRESQYQPPEREVEYFAENPELPTPDSLVAMRMTNNNTSSRNGVVVSVTYTYSVIGSGSIEDETNMYLTRLTEYGFSAVDTSGESDVDYMLIKNENEAGWILLNDDGTMTVAFYPELME